MANDIDVLTLDEAKLAVNLSQSRVGNEEQLEQVVTAVSMLLDDLCGPVVIRTVTDEVIYPANAHGPLELAQHPVSSITTLTEYVSGTGTVLTGEDFDTAGGYLLREGLLYRRSGWYPIGWNGVVKVTYQAGRYATTADVDAKFKRAASEIIAGNWQKYAAAWARGGDPLADPLFFDEVTNTVNRWLWAERRMDIGV